MPKRCQRNNTLPIPKHSLEWMSIAGLLHSAKHLLVDDEGDGDGEEGQGQVGHHRQHGEAGQGQQQHQHAAEHDARLLDVAPVDQVDDCGGETRVREFLGCAVGLWISTWGNFCFGW